MNWDSFICLSLLMVGGFFTKLISPMTLYTNRSVKIEFLEAMAERAHEFVKTLSRKQVRGNSSWNIPLPFLALAVSGARMRGHRNHHPESVGRP